MPKVFSSETSLSMSFRVDVQLIYRSFVSNVLSARRGLTTQHTIAYDISNQHNNKICYAIGHQQPNRIERSPIRSVVVTKFGKETRDRLWLYVFIKKRKRKRKRKATVNSAKCETTAHDAFCPITLA